MKIENVLLYYILNDFRKTLMLDPCECGYSLEDRVDIVLQQIAELQQELKSGGVMKISEEGH